MKRKIIYIGICILICIGLIVSILYFKKNYSPKANDSVKDMDVSTEYQRDGNTIYSVNEYILQSVSVSNEHGQFMVYKDSDGKVYISGYENVPILTYGPEALYSCAVDLKVESTIEINSSNLEYYGLDNPQASLTVSKTTGSEDVFYLGDKTPDGGGYYFRNASNNNVYVVSTYFAERLLKDKSDYYSKDIYVLYDYDTDGFNTFEVDHPGEDDVYARFCTQQELDSKKYEGSMLLEKPFLFGANVKNIRTSVESIKKVTAKSIICDDINPESLKKYGLDNPTKVTVDINVDVSKPVINNEENKYYDKSAKDGKIVSVKINYYVGSFNDETKECYVMYNDANVIYTVDSSVFDFVNKTSDYYCQYLLSIVYLKELKSITFDVSGETYVIQTSAQTDTSGATVFSGTYQEKPLDAKSLQNLYKYITGVSQIGYSEKPSSQNVYMTVTLQKNDGTSTIIEYTPLDDNNLYYFAEVDGHGLFKVFYSDIDKIVNNLQRLIHGQQVDYVN